MTYASINEVWGGVSGNNQLTTPLESTRHPIHQQQMMNRKYPEPRVHNSNDLYKCKYGSHDCESIFKQNEEYNNKQKNIAEGLQAFPPNSPQPNNYTYLPQYPWYNNAINGYMMYGPQLSNMWYNNPFQYNPGIANQILMQQMYGSLGNMTPIGPYYPQGFSHLDSRYNINPPLKQFEYGRNSNRKIRENFSDGRSEAIKAGMVYFIFFLVALAVILCISMICIVSTSK